MLYRAGEGTVAAERFGGRVLVPQNPGLRLCLRKRRKEEGLLQERGGGDEVLPGAGNEAGGEREGFDREEGENEGEKFGGGEGSGERGGRSMREKAVHVLLSQSSTVRCLW